MTYNNYEKHMCSDVISHEYYPNILQANEPCASDMDSLKKSPLYTLAQTLTGYQQAAEMKTGAEA
ncbi:MAG: hypothetical protein HQK97_03380 [Nitrospirae bacterium]|nr:hypothetical protein [Nitrospirota bacterium]